MRGYEVVTSGKRRVGRVVDVTNDYLIVRAGRLRRSTRPIPHEFAHALDEIATVVVTVPRSVFREAPRVDKRGGFDAREAARHFGLGEPSRRRSGSTGDRRA